MNFNLMSPSDNGHDFVVRFRDPITIKPNSKIALNFLEMSREGVVVFDTDQTFTIKFGDPLNNEQTLPEKIPADADEIEGSFTSGTIPAGTYEYSALQALLKSELETIITTIDASFAGFASRYQAVSELRDASTTTLALGLALKESDIEPMTLSTTHSHDAAASGAGFLYSTSNDTGNYDNYALINEVQDMFRKADDDAAFDGYAYFESTQPFTSWTGSHFCGLYSVDYADGIDTPPTRTTGNAPPDLVGIGAGAGTIPGCFIGLNFNASSGELEVLGANDTGGNLFTTWDSMNQEIDSYALIDRIPIATSFGATTNLQFAWTFEYNNTGGLSSGIRWKLIANPNSTRDVVFDSLSNRVNIPAKFFVGTDITYDDESAIYSQNSLGFMLSMTNDAPDGWSDRCALTEFNQGTDSAKPGIVLLGYQIEATPSLKQVLQLPTDSGTDITEYLPNAKPDSAFVARADVDLNWKADNYSIFINLPANAYKNVRLARDGGFKKSILANVPSPFLTGVVNIHQGSDQQQVSSLYQPYTPIVYSLQNNEIQTNNLEIKIVHMDDETPATEIDSSVVNFTIHNE